MLGPRPLALLAWTALTALAGLATLLLLDLGGAPLALATWAGAVALHGVVGRWAQRVTVDAMDDADGEATVAYPLGRRAEDLAAAVGTRPVDTRVIAEDNPVALVHGGRSPTVVVSTGLVDSLDDAETDAVLAHELGHVAVASQHKQLLRNAATDVVGLAAALSIAAVAVGGTWLAAVAAGYGVLRLLALLGSRRAVLASILASGLTVPLVVVVGRAIARADELRADRVASDVVGEAPLEGALSTLATATTDDLPGATDEREVRDEEASALRSLFATHPSMDERIRRLETA